MCGDKSKFHIGAATFIILFVFSIAYFSAYAITGKRGTISGPFMNGEARCFRHHWQVSLFRPAAKVESIVRGENVYAQQWDGK